MKGDGSSPENAINISSGLKMESVPSAVTYYEDGNGGTAVYTPATLSGEEVDTFVLNDMMIVAQAGTYEALKFANSTTVKIIVNGTNVIKGASNVSQKYGVALKADYCTVTLEIKEGASLSLIAGENLSEGAWSNVGYTSAYGTLHIVNNGTITMQEGNYTNNGSHCEAVNVSNIMISGNGITNILGKLKTIYSAQINTTGTVNISSMNEAIEIDYDDFQINSGTMNIESKGEKVFISNGHKINVADGVSGSISSRNGQVEYVDNHSENFNVYRISGTGNLLFRIDEENSELYVSEDAGVSWASLGIVKGNDGVGIQDVSINEAGELIVTLTDGTIYNLGNIHGKDGVGVEDIKMDENGMGIPSMVLSISALLCSIVFLIKISKK